MSNLSLVSQEIETNELKAALLCYQAETNQIASLLAQYSTQNPGVERKLLLHVLGTTNSYMDSILKEIQR